jgi:hypothetical protein
VKTRRKRSRQNGLATEMNGHRAALLVRCSAEEAASIRAAAMRERRTISGFILHAVGTRIRAYERIASANQGGSVGANGRRSQISVLSGARQTAALV